MYFFCSAFCPCFYFDEVQAFSHISYIYSSGRFLSTFSCHYSFAHQIKNCVSETRYFGGVLMVNDWLAGDGYTVIFPLSISCLRLCSMGASTLLAETIPGRAVASICRIKSDCCFENILRHLSSE
jgi:hypothetical protein